MPLRKGKSDDDVSANIAELIRAGHSQKQAEAISYRVAGRDSTACDMSPDDWNGLLGGLIKFFMEETQEPEHANDTRLAMDRSLYDAKGKRVMSSDRMAFDRQTVRRYDADGHLHIDRTPISKANICEYYGHEIPNAEELGLDPQRKYRLLRDPEELKKAADSSNGKQLLLGHIAVNADEPQKDKQVGSTGTDAEFEFPYLYNSLHLHDREGIQAIEDADKANEARDENGPDDQGAKELSSAYRYRADMTPGVYLGNAYDGVMRDIDFNHIALVPEGRAGADVVVADSKPNGEVFMSKLVLSRRGTFMAGAVSAYLMPKLALDSKLDVAPFFKGVTSKNFKDKKAQIAEDIKSKAKLAKDADLDDLMGMLDMCQDKEVEEGEDADPSSGLPMNAEEMAKKAKDEKDEKDEKDKKEASDRKAARDAFLTGKGMKAEDIKAMDDMMGESSEAEDEVEEEPKKKAEDDAGEPKITKSAMDAAIKIATTKATQDALRTANEISEAKEIAFKWVGRLAMDAVAPSDVYKIALDHLKIDVKDVHPSAFRRILEAQPIPGSKDTRLATDSAPNVTAFNQRHGNIVDRIGHAG